MLLPIKGVVNIIGKKWSISPEQVVRMDRNLHIGQYDYPEIGYKQAQGILGLTKSYTPERIENACKRALGFEKSSYHTIEKILKNKMDITDLFSGQDHVTPDHGNIRGSYK